MGSQKWSDRQFGERVKRSRAEAGWTQTEFAKMLADNGVQPMHATTVAKIEAGTRSVRINEAIGIADLLGVSLDALMGRALGPTDADLNFALRVLRDNIQQHIDRASELKHGISQQASEIWHGFEFDGAEDLRKAAEKAQRRLDTVYTAVDELASLTDDLMRNTRKAMRKPVVYAKVTRDD